MSAEHCTEEVGVASPDDADLLSAGDTVFVVTIYDPALETIKPVVFRNRDRAERFRDAEIADERTAVLSEERIQDDAAPRFVVVKSELPDNPTPWEIHDTEANDLVVGAWTHRQSADADAHLLNNAHARGGEDQ